MALSYGFFNAMLDESGEYDRVYAAEEFAEYFHLIVSNGVFPNPATQLQVIANDTPDMNVNVSDGYGWINGYFAKNSGAYSLEIQPADGAFTRIDAVVLRWVNASRSMELAVKTGTAVTFPEVPALERSADVYELMLASISVAAGTTSITQSVITDTRPDTSVCGWVTGAVQNIDTTNLFAQYDDAFQTWFADLQEQLSGDVATNLQNQINNVSIRAEDTYTKDETLDADTKNTLGLSEDAVPKDAFLGLYDKILGSVRIERITTSMIWTAPKAKGQNFRVFCCGGGGGGGGGGDRDKTTDGGGGGGGGYVVIEDLVLQQGTSVAVTIGAGGLRGTSTSAGSAGGSSSFGGHITANGGGGGGLGPGGNGGNGCGGGGGGSSYRGTGGNGGAGSVYGGGGGGGRSDDGYKAGNGGAGGSYGGGGGGGYGLSDGGINGTGGAGGSYGGGGGGASSAGASGQKKVMDLVYDLLLTKFESALNSTAPGGRGDNAGDYGGGGGGGGYGGPGGNGGDYGGGGGGGYGGSGGRGDYGGGGGGGYHSNGVSAGASSAPGPGGGGGSLFAYGLGGRGGYGTGMGATGTDGAVFILYFVEA